MPKQEPAHATTPSAVVAVGIATLAASRADAHDEESSVPETWIRSSNVVVKPWGREEIFGYVEGKFCGKLLYIAAGASLSLQYHERKEEAMTLVSGEVEVLLGHDTDALVRRSLGAGDTLHLSPGRLHQLVAVTDAVVAEVSTTELEDVVRVRDRYGRGAEHAR